MSNIWIKGWSGRLGNNIIQLKNAIQLAVSKNYNVIIPRHRYFSKTYICLNKQIGINSKRISDPNNYFDSPTIPDIDQNRVLQILRGCFTIKDVKALDAEDLVIHIRSGDIFDKDPECPGYIMPPLSYYVDIIRTNTFKNIYLIAEDRKNPCINALLELYPTIQFELQPLEKDIRLILGAVNVVASYGTMIDSLLLFSNNIKRVYRPSYYLRIINQDRINYITIDLDKYKEILSPWKNTAEQRETMLVYRKVIN
jgi:hypothetical protein